MRALLDGRDIRGIVCAVPENVVTNDDMVQRGWFDAPTVKTVGEGVGVKERRWAIPTHSVVDYAHVAAKELLDALNWKDIDAMVFVTQTPDRPAPPTGILLQQKLGVGVQCAAFDVNLGCSGYPYGLYLLGSMLRKGQRGLLIAGDLCSRYLDKADRTTALLFGDCISATAIEYVDQPRIGNGWSFLLGSDGSGAGHLRIEREHRPDCTSTLRMDGPTVFGFTLERVPQIYRELVGNFSQPEKVLLHQANKMIVKHIARKLAYPAISNLELRGNTSAASIPLLMCDNLGYELMNRRIYLGLLGYGIGWSWAGALLNVGPLVTTKVVEL